MAENKTKIDIFSGFLGAGKTTLIKKLIQEAFKGEKIVLIENEFGEIGIDGGFMREAGIQVNELNSGCICCSLVGDFREALKKVVETYHPDRILIEPSGVGKLSDVTRAVEGRGYAWLDTGTMDSLVEAATFVQTVEQRQGIKISAPEEIAYKYGWITKEKLLESAARYGKSPYGQHLKNVADDKLQY